MDCLVQHPQSSLWTGVVPHGLPSYHQRNYFSNFYFPRKPSFHSPFYQGSGFFFPNSDDVDYPTDIKGELPTTMPYGCMVDDSHEIKVCVVCGERASGFYFGALVCLPCKSFYIRCTKDGEPTFTCQCNGNCDIVKQGRIRCQYCRYQRCLMAGMCRKEKPESVQPAEGQVLCKVCGDIANGIHFGVNTCEGCKKFFRRGLVENQSYVCKGEKKCGINPRNRNNCRYCRYQKCLGVGMSREAIKMGRPKKVEGSDMMPPNSTSPNPPDSPETPTPQHTTNLVSSSSDEGRQEDHQHMKINCENIKTEDNKQSCKERNQSWNQSAHSRWPTNQQTTPADGKAPNVLASNDFIEEEMDELLMILQNDNQSVEPDLARNWRQGSKKMRCYDYGQIEAVKEEYQSPLELWNMDTPRMTSSSVGLNEPMNMSASHLAKQQIHNRPPPPQYPGYQNGLNQDSMHLNPMNPNAMHVSPCNSPNSTSAQMHSPGGYMSDNQSVGSPGVPMMHSPGGYPSEGSPVHSPCQFSPSPHHSPYHNPHSPQHSPCHDVSQQNSPYHEPVYETLNQSLPYQQPVNNLSVNCSQSLAANPPMMSPNYSTNQMTARNSSMPMTIPTQEGRGSLAPQGSWSGMPMNQPHSPQMSSYSHSHPSCSATIPNQERSFRHNIPCHSQKQLVTLENLQRINQHFLTPLYSCSEACLELLDDGDLNRCMTRNDIEREVVFKTLTSMNPIDSYNYVLTGENSSDGNCSSSSLDEFTSCRRQNKRKYCDDSDMSETSRCEAGVQIGGYKRQLTEKYWREASLGVECFPMTTDKQNVLEHLWSAYRQMADRCSRTQSTSCMTQGGNLSKTSSEGRQQWEQIQMRIVKNTAAAVKFASQIPGFSHLHPEDKTFLCKTVTFMNSVLLAGHQQYNPAEKSFQDFWNWPINPQNPFYPFKQALLQLGERIHAANMDVYEVSALAALMFLSTDFLDLVYPEAIEEARHRIIGALQSYEIGKGNDVKSRLGQLFDLVPEIRHIGMWHTEMMKQMKVNIQVHEVHQLLQNVGM